MQYFFIIMKVQIISYYIILIDCCMQSIKKILLTELLQFMLSPHTSCLNLFTCVAKLIGNYYILTIYITRSFSYWIKLY